MHIIEHALIFCAYLVIKHVLCFCFAVRRFGVTIVIDAEFQNTDYDLTSRRMLEIKEEVPSLFQTLSYSTNSV